MSMRRVLALLVGVVAAPVLLAGCKDATCKNGTVFVRMHWTPDVADADSIDVAVVVDGGLPTITHVARPSSGGFASIEIDFSTYPAGKRVSVTVSANKGDTVVAVEAGSMTLRSSCGALDLADTSSMSGEDMSAVAGDGGGDDMTTVDLATPPDLTPNVSPMLSIDKTMFDFSTVTIGQNTSTSFMITNSGTAKSDALTTALTNATNGVTLGTDGCNGTMLDVNQSCAVQVKFTPTAASSAGGTLTVSSPSAGMVQGTLTGMGVTPGALTLSPSPVPYGNVTDGATKSLDITAKNTGGASIGPLGTPTLSGTDAGQFMIMSQNCSGQTLASMMTCTITVLGKPTTPGTKSATLNLSGAVTTLNMTVLGKLGDSCTMFTDCGAGVACVDSRCCGSAACSSCNACNIDASGSCKPVAAGTADPKGMCTNDPSNCTLNTCNGSGGCAFVAANTTCKTTCANGAVTVGQVASSTFTRYICTGTGAGCTTADTSPTAPTCNNVICLDNFNCRATCRYDADCDRNYWCQAGTCKLRGVFGAGCGGDDQCQSGVCAGGSCADCRTSITPRTLSTSATTNMQLPGPSEDCPPSAPLCAGGHCMNGCTGNVCVYQMGGVSPAYFVFASCGIGSWNGTTTYFDQCDGYWFPPSPQPVGFNYVDYGSCRASGGSCVCTGKVRRIRRTRATAAARRPASAAPAAAARRAASVRPISSAPPACARWRSASTASPTPIALLVRATRPPTCATRARKASRASRCTTAPTIRRRRASRPTARARATTTAPRATSPTARSMSGGLSRRGFVRGALGALALAGCRRGGGGGAAARAEDGPWILSPSEHHVALFAPGSGGRSELAVPIAAHSFVSTPRRRGRALVFAKNAPIALDLDYREHRIVRQLESSPDWLFYGHGAYADGGDHFYATELHRVNGVGAIVVRDADSFRILGEFPSHGASPHDCRLVDGGRTMIVANAGLPQTYAQSTLTWVDVPSGRLLRTLENPKPSVHLTHFAAARDGAVVVTSAPNVGRPTAPGALFVAPPDGVLSEVTLPPPIAAQIHDETLSVAIAESRRIAAITVPAGNLLLFVHVPDGAFVAARTLDRPAGVVLSPDGAHFIVGARHSLRWFAVDTLAEDPRRATADGAGCTAHLAIASA